MDEVQDATLGGEIARLHAEHRSYAQRLEELLQKPYLSEDEQIEEVRLKKLKLHAKDLIYRAGAAFARCSLIPAVFAGQLGLMEFRARPAPGVSGPRGLLLRETTV